MALVRPTNDDVPGYLQELYKQLTLRPESWTPVLTCATPGDLSVSYTTQFGRKKLIGNYGLAWWNIVTSAFSYGGTASGSVHITGLGETALNVTSLRNFGVLDYQGITKANYTTFTPQLNANSAVIIFSAAGSAQTRADLEIGDLPTGGDVILRGWILFPI